MRDLWNPGAGRRRAAAVLVAALAPLALGACASYVAQTRDVRPLLARADYAGALKTIEKTDSRGSRLLYLYQRGLVLHYSGDPRASNEALEQADQLYEDLYTRSLSREIAALTVTDNLLEYRGERYEAALVHYYKALNYLALGSPEEAVVECRRLNHRLQVFRDAGGSFYRDDPFLQYLTGMIFAANGEHVEADVSLRQALESFRAAGAERGIEAPHALLCDLAENSEALGNAEDARLYREQCPCPPRPAAGTGRLNLFLECGYVPARTEQELVLPIYKDEAREGLDEDGFCRAIVARRGRPREAHRELDYLLKIAVPALEALPPRYLAAQVRPVGADTTIPSAPAATVEDLAVLARHALEDRQAEIALRAVSRGVTKYLATREARKKGDQAAGWLVNFAGAMTEVADTRCWSALPERIMVSRLDLPAGLYDLEIALVGPSGERTGTVRLPGVEVIAGETRFLSHRVY